MKYYKVNTKIKCFSLIEIGIRVIKFFAWENSYKKLINDIRNQELASLVQFWLYCALALFVFD